MDTINSRIAAAIEALGKKKTQVAKDLGITDSSMSTICSGKSNPSRQTVQTFCGLYGVSQKWLETGDGDMMVPRSREEAIAEYVGKMIKGDNEFQKALIEVILTRSPEELEVFRKAFEDLAKSLK